jgi:hypothetical protein
MSVVLFVIPAACLPVGGSLSRNPGINNNIILSQAWIPVFQAVAVSKRLA